MLINKISVDLTPDEIALGAHHAVMRRNKKHMGFRGDREQTQSSSWDNEINGVLAELAWCKFRNIYWSGVSDLKAKDGGDIEIRWTHHTGRGGLIVYNKDNDDSIFILSEGYAPTIFFVGWQRGSFAKENAVQVGGIKILPREKLMKIQV